jgi:hypothetical protein
MIASQRETGGGTKLDQSGKVDDEEGYIDPYPIDVGQAVRSTSSIYCSGVGSEYGVHQPFPQAPAPAVAKATLHRQANLPDRFGQESEG